MSQISTSRKLAILKTFSNQFPELTIIHVLALMGGFASSPCLPQHKILFAAVLTVIKARLEPADVPWTDTLRSREEYAEYMRARLLEALLGSPKIEFVQALLIITLHEWGTRDFHKAWMYCGNILISSLFWLCTKYHRHGYPHDASAIQHAYRPISPRPDLQ